MKTGYLKSAAVLLSAGMLSGCVAAYAIPMAAGGIAGGLGTSMLIDSLEGSGGGLTFNPAMKRHPDLGDPELSAWHDRLVAELPAFAANANARLSTSDPVCTLREDAIWPIAMGMSEDEYRRAQPTGAASLNEQVEAVLIEGECRDGAPEGPFVAISSFRSDAFTLRARVTGEMRDGQLVGERTEYRQSQSHLSGGISRYVEGRATRSLSLAPSRDDSPVHIVTVTDRTDPETGSGRVWYGEILQASSQQNRDGQHHGWTIYYPVQMFQEIPPNPAAPTCFQNGLQADDSLCGPRPAGS